jgi:hypothetical protein
MHDDELDRILRADQPIAPSPMFASKVMHAVYREAATPPPIGFPWKRALPGIAATLLAVFYGWKAGPVDVPADWIAVASRLGIHWVLLALAAAGAALAAARRLASR